MASLDNDKTAVSMYFMLKHAEQLGHIDAELLAEKLGHKPSYATEINKARKVARVIKENGGL